MDHCSPPNRAITAISLVFSLALWSSPSLAAPDTALVPQVWQMLDYMAADYEEAVKDGEIIDEAEYEEMLDFSKTVGEHLQKLPEKPERQSLIAQSEALLSAIQAKKNPPEVRRIAHDLNEALLLAYPMPMAPKKAPNLERGKSLYMAACTTCHGEEGAGDGLAATEEMGVLPLNDEDRADQRSPLSFYQTVTQGVDGTSMAAFESAFSEEERWDIAYYASTLAYRGRHQKGQSLWENNEQIRSYVMNLNELSRTRTEQLDHVLSLDESRSLLGYLRESPEAVEKALSGIPLARGRLQSSLKAYANQEFDEAIQLALSSYLDGVEPVEPLLDVHNTPLRQDIELQMGLYRTQLSKRAPLQEIENQVLRVDQLLQDADALLRDHIASPGTTFLGAFTILLREGLEALLIVIGLIAFLRSTEHKHYLTYVHLGWISALLLGLATWFVARYFIEISGASRELTEGISALFAALVLLGVGLWMHQKSIGGRWQAYLKEKMGTALNKRSAWLFFTLAFVAVYREMFETILFYAAIWQDEHAPWFFSGMGLALAFLAVIAWAMLATSKRLPIHRFFQVSTWLIAILAFILAGKGIAALQEAGWVLVHLAPIPRISLLGIYPTWETTAAQAFILLVLFFGIWRQKRSSQQEALAKGA